MLQMIFKRGLDRVQIKNDDIRESVDFLLSHQSHSYRACGTQEVFVIDQNDQTLQKADELKKKILKYQQAEISVWS